MNHNVRKESAKEKEFLENWCKKNDILFESMVIEKYGDDNFHNEARAIRYNYFESLIKKYNANYLMTAHHGDDLVETIMMRLVRGSSIKGYGGFKKEIDMKSYKLIRPFITLTKDDILNYMNSNNYKYYIDKSNYSKEYTRNRYRLDVLPFLKKENKAVHLKFLKFSEELDMVNNFLDNYIKDLIIDLKDSKGIKIDKLLELDDFLIKKIVEYELSLIYVNDLFLVSDKNTDMIINLIKNNKTNGKINLPNKFVALKEYNYFKIVNNIKDEDYKYILDDELILKNGIIKRIDKSDNSSNYVIRLNSKDFVLPIIVRNRLDGDKIFIKNLNGSKKVKDIFIDEKIPGDKRNNIPIVTDSENTILWIPGIKKSKFDVERNGIYDIILSYEEDKND